MIHPSVSVSLCSGDLEKLTSPVNLAQLLLHAFLSANSSGDVPSEEISSKLGPVTLIDTAAGPGAGGRVAVASAPNEGETCKTSEIADCEQFVVFAHCGHRLPIDPLRGPLVDHVIWDEFIRLGLIRTVELVKRTLTWSPIVPTCPLCLSQNKGF